MYLPVQVGSAGKDGIGYQRDDEGDNISQLNSCFCELTGLYWGWKNLSADYMGLAHYRRHFANSRRAKNPWEKILRYEDIKNDIGKVQVFVPSKRRYYIETLYSHYSHTFFEDHLLAVREIVERQYPDYISVFDKTCQQRWGYMFNMMIMRYDLLDSYCDWLFSILFQLQEVIGEEGMSSFHARYCGRVSEILFNVWLNKQLETGIISDERIKELPVIPMEHVNWWKKGISFLKAKFLGKKYEASF